jgi:hypothetical protein
MRLAGGSFRACGKRASANAAKRNVVRRLWGDGQGRFRTTGRYAAATLRGTVRTMADTCSTTTTFVAKGSVTVRDFVKRKTVVVTAGRSYRAKKA